MGEMTSRLMRWLRRLADATIFRRRRRLDKPVDAAPEQVHRTMFAYNGGLNLAPIVRPSRSAQLLIPPARTKPAGRLLVLLHGCRQHAADFAIDTGANRLCTTHGWHVLLPDQARLANLYRCWNWFDGSVFRGGGEVAIVTRGIEEVCAEYGLPESNVCIAGMSSGAGLAAALCAHHPQRFRAALLHSGVAYGASTSSLHARRAIREGPQRDTTKLVTPVEPGNSGPAVMVVHGADDAVVVPTHADETMRQMLALNGELEPGAALPSVPSKQTAQGGGFTVQTRQFGKHQQLTVTGLAHAWSGGTRPAQYFEPDAPDALTLFRRFVDGLPATRVG